MRRRTFLLALLSATGLLGVGGGVGHAAEPAENSGLPIPRYVSLRATRANLRIGPGVQYPVEWVYQRSGLPLEIIAEHKTWRKVRDWEGAQGWLHQSMLSGKRALIITAKGRAVRAEPDDKAPAIAQVEPGVVGMVLQCKKGNPWCRVEVDNYVGWLRRSDIWGVYEDEAIE